MCFLFLTYFSGTKGQRPTFSLKASSACILIFQGIVFCSLINCDIVSNYLKGSRITSKFMKSDAKNRTSQCMSEPILHWDPCMSQLSYFEDMYWCLWWLLANIKPPLILLPPRKLQHHSWCEGWRTIWSGSLLLRTKPSICLTSLYSVNWSTTFISPFLTKKYLTTPKFVKRS